MASPLTVSVARADPPSPSPASDVPVAGGISGRDATALVDRLGPARTGGVHIDPISRRLVVSVTDDAAAKAVREAGGIARRVNYSTARLDSIKGKLNETMSVPGTSWGTDPLTNQVSVEADSTVSEKDLQKLKDTVESFGGAARVSRTGGKLAKTISGGNYIVSDDGWQCSVGFNVRKKSDPSSLYFVTAGHCTVDSTGVSDWRDGNGTYVGYDAGGFYPENDFGLVRHYNASVSKPGNVYLHDGSYQDITHSRDPYLNEFVCKSGWRTKRTCGYVIQTGVTVNYGDGNIYDLFISTACNQPGDSGGPVFNGDAALGLTSGWNGVTDVPGCRSYSQRVNEALAWYGVEVY